MIRPRGRLGACKIKWEWASSPPPPHLTDKEIPQTSMYYEISFNYVVLFHPDNAICMAEFFCCNTNIDALDIRSIKSTPDN